MRVGLVIVSLCLILRVIALRQCFLKKTNLQTRSVPCYLQNTSSSNRQRSSRRCSATFYDRYVCRTAELELSGLSSNESLVSPASLIVSVDVYCLGFNDTGFPSLNITIEASGTRLSHPPL